MVPPTKIEEEVIEEEEVVKPKEVVEVVVVVEVASLDPAIPKQWKGPATYIINLVQKPGRVRIVTVAP